MKAFDELKNIVFEEADYYGACADDLFFTDDERDEYGVKLEELCNMMRALGWYQEYQEA